MHFRSTDPNHQPDVIKTEKRQQSPTDGKMFYLFLAAVSMASFLFGIYFRGN